MNRIQHIEQEIFELRAQLKTHKLYENLRVFRENKTFDRQIYTALFKEIKKNCPDEWLILLELYEVVCFNNTTLAKEVHIELVRLKRNENLKQLICDGLDIIKKH